MPQPVVELELVEMADHLMLREDPKVGAFIQPCLAEDSEGYLGALERLAL